MHMLHGCDNVRWLVFQLLQENPAIRTRHHHSWCKNISWGMLDVHVFVDEGHLHVLCTLYPVPTVWVPDQSFGGIAGYIQVGDKLVHGMCMCHLHACVYRVFCIAI